MKEQYEDSPKRETISQSRIKGWERRHSGVMFKALRGMLRKGVGRPWAKVHSEILAYVKAEFGEKHVRGLMGRIQWHVEESPMDVGDGVLVQNDGRRFYTHREDQYYVDAHGLLKRPKKEWGDAKLARPRLFDVSPDTYRWWRHDAVYIQNRCYREMGGIWYEVILEAVPKPPMNNPYDGTSCHYGDKDWLYKLDLYDHVLKKRLRSFNIQDLGACHGYRTFQNKLVSDKEYREMLSKAMKRQYFGGMYVSPRDWPLIDGRHLYAKALRQLSKAEIRRYGLGAEKLKLPNIVR